jgi:hypothetical protein
MPYMEDYYPPPDYGKQNAVPPIEQLPDLFDMISVLRREWAASRHCAQRLDGLQQPINPALCRFGRFGMKPVMCLLNVAFSGFRDLNAKGLHAAS